MRQNSLFEFTQRLTEGFVEAENIYVPLGFRGNPFPSVPVPPDPPTMLVDQERIQDEVISAIKRASETQQCTALLLLSFPGDGKSHVLKFLENAINKSFRDERWAIAVYVEGPGEGLLDICRSFITRPHIEFWRGLLLDVVRDRELAKLDRVAKVYFDAPEQMFSADEVHSQKEKPIDKETLKQFEDTQLPRVLDRLEAYLYREVTRNSDFSRALTRLLDPNKCATAWKFLTINRLTRDEAGELGISTTSVTEAAAVDYLASLLRLLAGIYKVGLVFIDELETVKRLHPTKKKKLYHDLRKLLDNLPNSTIVVFTCDSDDYREIYIEAIPLARRLTDVFTIFPIRDTSEAERYIIEYLESVRIGPPRDDGVLFPFTPDVAKAVFQKVAKQQKRCEVGRFLVRCHFLFEGWAKKGEEGMPITEADLEAMDISSQEGR